MIIYKATNLINGKVYIGQTIYSLKLRKKNHIREIKTRSQSHFSRALFKDGINNFKWQIICICPDLNSLNEQEQFYIVFYNSMRSGYNMTSGGLNFTRCEATKRRMSESRRGDKCWWYGKHHKKESIEKNRQTQKGRKFTKEHRENMCKAAQKRGKGKDSPNYGVRRSKEARKRMSEAQLLRYKRERWEVLK